MILVLSAAKAHPGKGYQSTPEKAVPAPEVVARLDGLDRTADWTAFNGLCGGRIGCYYGTGRPGGLLEN